MSTIESEVSFKGLTFNLNVGDKEFTQEEKANRQQILDAIESENFALAQTLISEKSILVGIARSDENEAGQALKDGHYWTEGLEMLHSTMPILSDYEDSEQGRIKFQTELANYEATRKLYLSAIEAVRSATVENLKSGQKISDLLTT